MSYSYKLFFDGASKQNPGPSGCGFVIYENDIEVGCGSAFVGENSTNNYAEYSGLIMGLDRAIDLDLKEIQVYGDSKLVIEQMKGNWKVNSENLRNMYHRAKDLEKKFDKITFTHVYREFNKRADELSNEFLKLVDPVPVCLGLDKPKEEEDDITKAMSKFIELKTTIDKLTVEKEECRSIIDKHFKTNQLSSKDHTIKGQQYTINRTERSSSVWKSKKEIPESVWTMYHTTKSTTYITVLTKRKEIEQAPPRLLPKMIL